MKFGFVTCVQLGKSCMDAIYQVGGTLNLVITLEDNQALKKSGRIYLDNFCTSKKIALLKSSHINNTDCVKAIKKHKIDWLFIIGWSQIAKAPILSAPLRGVLGIHPTLLPQGRGRASIPWAILKGLKKTGVTLFKLDEGVDTGEILEQRTIHLDDKITATTLYDLVNDSHIELISSIFPKLQSDTIILKKQDKNLASEWPERVAADGEIDLNGSVHDAEKLIRAVTRPYPGAFIVMDKQKFIVWSACVSTNGIPASAIGLKFNDGYLVFQEYDVSYSG